ncbi:Hypothetical predicted protein, partial [Paramuricea clavata]
VSQSSVPLFDQTNPSTSKNQASQQPPRVSTAVDNRISLEIIPNKCSIKGGCSFILHAKKALQGGIFHVKFGNYGTCKASGSGNEYLHGLEDIPPALRRGTHLVDVQVSDETGKIIDTIIFQYEDHEATERAHTLRSKGLRSSDGSNPPNERLKPTEKSSDSDGYTGSPEKKPRNVPIDMTMLMYLCDEMAAEGDEHFFSALIKLRIMAAVLENHSGYYKDFAETARENGHNKLAETIETSSRELSCGLHMEALTFGKLHDAVQEERSLSKSDSINSSDSDDNSNPCSSDYDGDCDSEDDQSMNKSVNENEDDTDAVLGGCESQNYDRLNEETNSKNDVIIYEPEPVADSLADGQCCTNGNLKGNGDKTDAVLGSCNSHCYGNLNEEKNSVNVPEPVTRASLKREPEPVTIDVEKEEHIFEDEDNEDFSLYLLGREFSKP